VWCDIDPVTHLDSLVTDETLSAASHLADLIDVVFTMTDPFGERLQAAFFAADSDQVAEQLSNAHEMWTVCATGS
jgi:hypothetical protein